MILQNSQGLTGKKHGLKSGTTRVAAEATTVKKNGVKKMLVKY